MSYVPLSRIKTNLYTSGGEFVFTQNNQEYVGYYHQLFNGQYFSGTTPSQKNVYALTKIVAETTTVQTTPEENTTSISNKKLPAYYYPKPTQADYATQQFQRYFAKKINENIIIEITKETYNNLQAKSPTYYWQNYTTFQMPWQIAGNKQEVETTNKNITTLTEATNRIKGLKSYLKQNYLQFYLGN
jgi:hypothetical protein